MSQAKSDAFSADSGFIRGEQIGCGCCRGPENDRCCCHIHQDIPRGLRAHKCSIHNGEATCSQPGAHVPEHDNGNAQTMSDLDVWFYEDRGDWRAVAAILFTVESIRR